MRTGFTQLENQSIYCIKIHRMLGAIVTDAIIGTLFLLRPAFQKRTLEKQCFIMFVISAFWLK
jgi:hypothetical protein